MKKILSIVGLFFLSILGGFFYITYAEMNPPPTQTVTNKDVILSWSCTKCQILEWSTWKTKDSYSESKNMINNWSHTFSAYKDFYWRSQPQVTKTVDWIDKTLPLKMLGNVFFVSNNPTRLCSNENQNIQIKYKDSLNRKWSSSVTGRFPEKDRISGFSDPYFSDPYSSNWFTQVNKTIASSNNDTINQIISSQDWIRYNQNDKQEEIIIQYIFTRNESKDFFVRDRAWNESKRFPVTVNWIDKLPPSINGLSISKNGDSVFRVWQTYPIYFSGSDSRSAGVSEDKCPNTIRVAIYYYKDWVLDTSISQNPKVRNDIQPNVDISESITFSSNSQYGIILVIGDSAGNTVQKSIGRVPAWWVPNDTINNDLYSGRWNITNWDSGNSTLWDLLGVKIIGFFQWSSKVLAGQEANMTLVNAASTRDAIRKNAYTLIRNRSEWTLGWVKYVVWEDYIYDSSDNDYDTLIVKNGNLIIDSNISDSKNRGFIVLDENFDGNNGNIYIWSGVTDIKWILFGEWRLGQKENYTWSLLQLRILWTVFTRNTIGGSSNSLENGQFTLPGGKMTTNEDDAKKYDLNLFRAGNTGWDDASVPSATQFKDASLVIRYNPENSTNPPPGFGQ